ncbi:MAG: alpha/beta hydrolase [Ktedonobacterales bacterium]|nr:alpha/beta hydrolase [Ktedonobacterales bacterium]
MASGVPGKTAPTTSTPIAAGRTRPRQAGRLLMTSFLTLAGILGLGYLSLSVVIATQLVYSAPKALTRTPAALSLTYADVTFPSRGDHIPLRGWFIPGVLPGGRLTDDRVVITLHGNGGNRERVLNFSADLARHGFAILSFDMRGMGESPAAPLTLGYFEQRDVLGAVDFLRSGTLPFAQLGRPRIIGGWGVSMGAATMLLAAAQEPAIRAVVSDCAYADIVPILEREIPKRSNLPEAFTPGGLVATNFLFGVDYYQIRPEAVVARIAPRPLYFIHGTADAYIPPAHMATLATAARAAPGAQVQAWLVPGAGHAKSYDVATAEYISRMVSFFSSALGPDASAA